MPANPNQFRLFAYLAAAAVFFGLLAFMFLAAPDVKKMKLPTDQSRAEKNGSAFAKGSGSQGRRGTKRISDPSENVEAEEEPEKNDPSIAGELVLRADSKEELQKIWSRALAAGAIPKGVLLELPAARVKFPTREAADKFRDSVGDEAADANFLVMAPDFPDTSPNPNQDPNTGNTSTAGLEPFGNRALDFLGVTEDNSGWGEGVTVAILDSGVYPHEALAGTSIKQMDLVGTADDPQADYTGHGTAVADIVHSVAPRADLLSIRVLDSDGIGDTFTVAQGIIAATDNGADVINLSLGSYGNSVVLHDAVNYAAERGTAVVAATGNDGIEQVSYPAAYDNVIGVTAVDATGAFAEFSNFGDEVDLGAPGVGVNTAWEEDASVAFSGTSAATPFVAGAIAATITINEGYTTEQAAARIQHGAEDTGETGKDPLTGEGILQIDQ